jgi:hypothetical protein
MNQKILETIRDVISVFMGGFVKHPIQTSGQIVDSVSTLKIAEVVRNGQSMAFLGTESYQDLVQVQSVVELINFSQQAKRYFLIRKPKSVFN